MMFDFNPPVDREIEEYPREDWECPNCDPPCYTYVRKYVGFEGFGARVVDGVIRIDDERDWDEYDSVEEEKLLCTCGFEADVSGMEFDR
jgi:hypothetical protein